MSYRNDGTSIIQATADGDRTVAFALDAGFAGQIVDALNAQHPQGFAATRLDPLTGERVATLDVDERRPLREVLAPGQRVKVTGPYVPVEMDTPDGRQIRGLMQGAVLPGDVYAGKARHLLDVGLAVLIEDGAAAEDARAAGQEPDAGGPPPQSAPKAAWVDYAVSQRDEGVSEEDARNAAGILSKADLIAQYATPAS